MLEYLQQFDRQQVNKLVQYANPSILIDFHSLDEDQMRRSLLCLVREDILQCTANQDVRVRFRIELIRFMESAGLCGEINHRNSSDIYSDKDLVTGMCWFLETVQQDYVLGEPALVDRLNRSFSRRRADPSTCDSAMLAGAVYVHGIAINPDTGEYCDTRTRIGAGRANSSTLMQGLGMLCNELYTTWKKPVTADTDIVEEVV